MTSFSVRWQSDQFVDGIESMEKSMENHWTKKNQWKNSVEDQDVFVQYSIFQFEFSMSI